MRRLLLLSAIAFGIAVSAHAETSITGAGSTFAAPLYTKWGETYKTESVRHDPAPPSVSLNYQAVGSGAGINQINNRTVDFGASDMPVKDADLQAHHLMQFPTAIGGVVIVANLGPNVDGSKVKLTGPLLAAIYLGQITKWNDPRIVEIQDADVTMPNLTIAPAYRADGSGTTFVFTDYLSMMSPEWKTDVGASTSVHWKAGQGSKGNDGVSASVKMVKGGVGYVESAYAALNHLTTVRLRNHDGNFVTATMEAFKAAAASADWSKVQNFAIDLNDMPGAKSWPIESATFVLVPTDGDAAKTTLTKSFFNWCINQYDSVAEGLLYVPLPQSVKVKIRQAM